MPSNKKGEAVLQDVFRYNDWANGKLLALCEGLSESQWDAPHTMGFGSLRATLFHVLVADELWQDRLENKPWAPLPTDERQIALAELHARYAAVAERRRRILQQEHSTGYERLVEYMNTERQSFRHRLCELLLHLANHSIHHRAQALNMLRRQQRTVPGGLDYLFYKLATPLAAPTSRDGGVGAELEVRRGRSDRGNASVPCRATSPILRLRELGDGLVVDRGRGCGARRMDSRL